MGKGKSVLYPQPDFLHPVCLCTRTAELIFKPRLWGGHPCVQVVPVGTAYGILGDYYILG